MGQDLDRSDYLKSQLDADRLNRDPIEQLKQWLKDAHDESVIEPEAMCLSTVGPSGQPSSRFVLLREIDHRGLTFFTNYLSRKGDELAHNPQACLAFWWGQLERQVRVEGTIEKVAPSESDAYFASRPLGSQIASTVSPQSKVIPSREVLETQVAAMEGQPLTRPSHWGGYRLVPDYFEFWQGRGARLHDRFRYRLTGTDWLIERLAP